jgi:putative addiction module component (TIGR02574 family)
MGVTIRIVRLRCPRPPSWARWASDIVGSVRHVGRTLVLALLIASCGGMRTAAESSQPHGGVVPDGGSPPAVVRDDSEGQAAAGAPPEAPCPIANTELVGTDLSELTRWPVALTRALLTVIRDPRRQPMKAGAAPISSRGATRRGRQVKLYLVPQVAVTAGVHLRDGPRPPGRGASRPRVAPPRIQWGEADEMPHGRRCGTVTPMTDVDRVLAEAMKLSEAERSELAYRLVELVEHSTEPDSAIRAAWIAEAKRRLDDIDAGRAVAVPWEEARARIFAK